MASTSCGKWSEKTGNENPFQYSSDGKSGLVLIGSTTLGENLSPSFVDFNGDGLQDLFVGTSTTIRYLENITASGVIKFKENVDQNPFKSNLPSNGKDFYVVWADLDQDGDYDATIGNAAGEIVVYRRDSVSTLTKLEEKDVICTGSNVKCKTYTKTDCEKDAACSLVSNPNENPFFSARNTQDFAFSSLKSTTIAWTDVDTDGDLDAVVGDQLGSLFYFENIGMKGLITFKIGGNVGPSGTWTTETFVSTIHLIAQIGSVNPFNGIMTLENVAPTWIDIDCDCDMDLLVGGSASVATGASCASEDPSTNYKLFKNIGDTKPSVMARREGSSNPFFSLLSARISFSAPAFVDIDDDGDFDCFVGTKEGSIEYFENIGSPTNPVFTHQTSSSNNPLSMISDTNIYYTYPAFFDIDKDGDLDLFIGTEKAGINAEATLTTPLKFSRIVFADLDGDGESSLFIVVAKNRHPCLPDVACWKNDFTTNAYFAEHCKDSWTTASATGVPLIDVNVGSLAQPSFVDIDGDGDLDVFLGMTSFFENIGSSLSPVMEYRDAVMPFGALDFGVFTSISWVDIDGDNDPDAFVGDSEGNIHYFKNVRITDENIEIISVDFLSYSSTYGVTVSLNWTSSEMVESSTSKASNSPQYVVYYADSQDKAGKCGASNRNCGRVFPGMRTSTSISGLDPNVSYYYSIGVLQASHAENGAVYLPVKPPIDCKKKKSRRLSNGNHGRRLSSGGASKVLPPLPPDITKAYFVYRGPDPDPKANGSCSGKLSTSIVCTTLTTKDTCIAIDGCTFSDSHLVGGNILSIDSISGKDPNRKPGLYEVSVFSGGSTNSKGAVFTIKIDNESGKGGAVSVFIKNAGVKYKTNDTITVADSQLGGLGGVALTFDVATVSIALVASGVVSAGEPSCCAATTSYCFSGSSCVPPNTGMPNNIVRGTTKITDVCPAKKVNGNATLMCNNKKRELLLTSCTGTPKPCQHTDFQNNKSRCPTSNGCVYTVSGFIAQLALAWRNANAKLKSGEIRLDVKNYRVRWSKDALMKSNSKCIDLSSSPTPPPCDQIFVNLGNACDNREGCSWNSDGSCKGTATPCSDASMQGDKNKCTTFNGCKYIEQEKITQATILTTTSRNPVTADGDWYVDVTPYSVLGAGVPTTILKVQCGPGQFRPSSNEWLNLPFSLMNRSNGCAHCVPGKYQKNAGKSSCSICPAGKFNPDIASTDSSACVPCIAKTYCPAGSSEQLPCPAGFYCPQPNIKSLCATKGSKCPQGSTQEGTCPSGSFCSDPTKQKKCVLGVDDKTTSGVDESIGIHCPAGVTVPIQCEAGYICSNPSTKVKCNDGFYCPLGSISQTKCLKGHFCPTPLEQKACTRNYCVKIDDKGNQTKEPLIKDKTKCISSCSESAISVELLCKNVCTKSCTSSDGTGVTECSNANLYFTGSCDNPKSADIKDSCGHCSVAVKKTNTECSDVKGIWTAGVWTESTKETVDAEVNCKNAHSSCIYVGPPVGSQEVCSKGDHTKTGICLPNSPTNCYKTSQSACTNVAGCVWKTKVQCAAQDSSCCLHNCTDVAQTSTSCGKISGCSWKNLAWTPRQWTNHLWIEATLCEAGYTQQIICPAGYSCPTVSSKTACPAGTFCEAGSSNPVECPAEFYCPRSDTQQLWGLTKRPCVVELHHCPPKSVTANICLASAWCPVPSKQETITVKVIGTVRGYDVTSGLRYQNAIIDPTVAPTNYGSDTNTRKLSTNTRKLSTRDCLSPGQCELFDNTPWDSGGVIPIWVELSPNELKGLDKGTRFTNRHIVTCEIHTTNTANVQLEGAQIEINPSNGIGVFSNFKIIMPPGGTATMYISCTSVPNVRVSPLNEYPIDGFMKGIVDNLKVGEGQSETNFYKTIAPKRYFSVKLRPCTFFIIHFNFRCFIENSIFNKV
eukprot:GSMAST32.ASY1.ANO1.444.1 assembled CDS